jgi:hypothetical protein
MINTAVRRAAVLLATLAIPATLLVAPLPASAATSGSLCETNGAYCVNTANFSLYTPATESLTNARTIEAEPQIAPPGTDELVFKGDTSKCLGATNDGTKAEIKPCNGGSDIFWIEETSGGSAYWENTGATSTIGTKMYLSGNENLGSQYVLAAKGKNGTYQLFEFR